MLPTDKVLVTIGTPCSMSAVGSTDTFLARVERAGQPATLNQIEATIGARLRAEHANGRVRQD